MPDDLAAAVARASARLLGGVLIVRDRAADPASRAALEEAVRGLLDDHTRPPPRSVDELLGRLRRLEFAEALLRDLLATHDGGDDDGASLRWEEEE